MDKIPDSIKSPVSLKADYAEPRIYSLLSTIAGLFALVVGLFLAFRDLITAGVLILVGLALLLIGRWLCKAD